MCRLKYKKTRKRLSMILSLGFSDIITGISGLAVVIVRRCEKTAPVPRYACAFVMSLLEFGVTTSLFHTFCICLERFLAVRSKTFSKDVFGPTVRRNIFILWIIFGLIIGLFKFVTPKGSICTLPNLYGEYYALFVRIEVFGLWLPFLVGTVTLYAITTFIIRSQMTKVHQAPFNANLSIINNQNMNMYPDDNKQNTESRTTNDTNSRKAKNIENAVSTTTNDTNSRTAQTIRNTESSTTNDIDSRHTIHIQTVTNRISPRHATVVGIRQSNLNNITQRQNDYKTKAIKIVGIIVLVLVVTTGVGALAMAVDAVCEWCVSDEIRHATTLLWVVNSAVNPVIYVCVIKEFRQAVIRAFTCR